MAQQCSVPTIALSLQSLSSDLMVVLPKTVQASTQNHFKIKLESKEKIIEVTLGRSGDSRTVLGAS